MQIAACLDALADITRLRDRDLLDGGLVRLLGQFSGANRVALHRLLPGDEPRWLTRSQWGTDPAAVWIEPVWVDLRGQPLMDERPEWRDCLHWGKVRPWQAADGVTLLPLMVENTPIGVLELVHPQPFSSERLADTRLLLRVMENHLSLLDYSERDTLTGLLNRKSFDDSFYRASALPLTLAAEPNAERRHGDELRYWLGVVDIDHFKLVNDRFGHLIGDEVLLLLSRVMTNSFRHADQLYRFGGEEFVVLMRCGGEADAMGALERFRHAVRNFLFPQVERVTVSIGFTDVRVGDTPSAAVERADKAVYMAKHGGRDQVLSYAALLREGALAEETKDSDVEFF